MLEEKHSIKDFFISYNGADKAWAEWIAWQLEEALFSTVLQAWDFRPGANFVLKMQEASASAKRTVAVFSPNYLNAVYTQPEWAAAFRQDPEGTDSVLVPVMVRDCRRDLKGLLSQIVYINLVGLSEQEARKALLEGINKDRNKPKAPPLFPGVIQHHKLEEPNFPGRTGDDTSVRYSQEKPTLPKLKLNKSFNPYKTRDAWIEYIASSLREAIEGEASLDYYAEEVEGHKQIRILHNQDTIYSLNINKGALDRSDDGISFSYSIGPRSYIHGIHAWGYFKWDVEKESVVLELQDLSLISSLSLGGNKKYTREGFLEALWNRIRTEIERSAR